MDNLKDNQGNMSLTNQVNIDLFGYFNKNQKLYFIFKKTERIVSAIHLITNLFSEAEPLRASLRSLSFSILSAVISSKQNPKLSLLPDIIHIGSLLQIANDSGFISGMNYGIISREINDLGFVIKEYENTVLNQVMLDHSFFNVGFELPVQKEAQDHGVIKDNFYKGQNNVLYNNRHKSFIIKKDTMPNIKDNVKDNKSDRRQKILSIIGKKGVCTIKDFSHVITEYSEKTLQRELVSMVEEAVLIKEGEKRWSRYSLGKNL